MANLKYYDTATSEWKTLIVGAKGEQGDPGANGANGTDGADGATGPSGATGPGVAAGGTTGQILAKSSSTDYATEWASPPGIVLVHSESFTATTIKDFSNVFNSAYKNYKVIMEITPNANALLSFKLLNSGTPSDSNHYSVMYHQRTNGTVLTPTSGNPSASAGINIISAGVRGHGVYDIFEPQVAIPTEMTIHAISTDAGGVFLSTGILRHGQATAYNGFRISVNSGTMTGRVQVFGYKD